MSSEQNQIDEKPLETLRRTIEALYQVFARYPLRERIDGCAHCVSEADQEQLHAKPLRQLTAVDLDRFVSKAMSTWGEVDDLRHFLPRLLEVLAFEKDGLPAEVVTGKLAYGAWQTWPVGEKAAIDAYLGALWHYVLFRPPSFDLIGWTAEECLCGIAQAVPDLEPFLAYWEQQNTTPALLHLSTLLHDCAWGLILSPPVLGSPWWDERQEQMQQVIRWLFHPSRHQMIERALVAGPDCGNADCPGAVDELMTRLGATPPSEPGMSIE